MQLADGTRTLEDLARQAGIAVGPLVKTLEALVDLGAVRFSTGS
jgi:predicted transcriptional regulator